ncbi:MAG TPA: hypothetical protein VMC03_06285 [Streptosporangiaceae bacterium]|nr:hypothetical protein [Streptosporangiaceae bacterium]
MADAPMATQTPLVRVRRSTWCWRRGVAAGCPGAVVPGWGWPVAVPGWAAGWGCAVAAPDGAAGSGCPGGAGGWSWAVRAPA